MKRLRKIFIPQSSESRAHALRHEALFFYAIFLFLFQFSVSYFASAFPGILGFASNINPKEVFDSSNQIREQNGQAPLVWNEALAGAAQKKAQDMFSKNYWAHIAPDGVTPWTFILNAGYDYIYAGENLAKDFQNSDDVSSAWFASTGHRENLLSPKYNEMGIAVVNGTLNGFETTLVVQMFGARSGGPIAASAKIESTPTPTPVLARVTDIPTPTPTGIALRGPEAESPVVAPSGLNLGNAEPVYFPTEISKPLIPAVDVIKVAKTISFAFGFFLLALIVIDGVVVVRKKHLRLSGHNLAHLSVLVLLILATWYTSVGSVL